MSDFMRIAQILPGVGDTSTCVNCLRDAALLREFRKLGHEVRVVPLYLPFRPEGQEPAGQALFFFGGINVYLQQKSVIFRKTPRWLDRIFDNQKLLEWASRKFQMVNAQVLGQTTVSMLKGRDGYQVKEFDRLISWLNKKENRPDVVCLSNVLLAGLAKPLKQTIGVPVVCLLQDEDKFLNELSPPYSQQGWNILADCVCEIDGFIAVGEHYADVMKKRLAIGQEKMHVVCGGEIVAQKGATCNIDNLAEKIASVFTMILENFSEGDHA
ncbi:MAG: hypothetical protein ISS77_00275 [Phycisphaerae bacterium]|nr:hypothetical protein [Phycisphaerae bacterium]